MTDEYGLTVGRALKNILPAGTYPYFDEAIDDEIPGEGAFEADWSFPPVFPTDLFVAVSHLVYLSGLLNYFDPNPDYVHPKQSRPIAFTLSSEERAACIKAGHSWSENDTIPKLAERLWDDVFKARDKLLRASTHVSKSRASKEPKWWRSALQLLIIADEACVGLGAPASKDFPNRWMIDLFQVFAAKPFTAKKLSRGGAFRAKRQPTTYGVFSDPDVACVQPKGRVSSVGCNLRNLTCNVAYIPHVGSVRCHWQQPIASATDEDADNLDILIIPLPYHLDASAIVPSTEATPDHSKRPQWGNFEINQDWLTHPEAVLEAVIEEVQKAKKQLKSETLNGIIFPEYALTEDLFKDICEAIKLEEPDLEFAISGSSNNCDGEKANFVLTAIWDTNKTTKKYKDDRYLLTSRRKHHRWKLSPSQIKTYDLEAVLPVGADENSWWEPNCIAQREIHFFHFRKSSIITSMICEDLARSDPCHDILRAIGSNLVFALLMDGPQIDKRWPARYAATLADDPGTSVLTITSLGLLNRTNALGYFDKSTAIAMWRDEGGETRSLSLDDDSKSLLLSLKASKVSDLTLDGRINSASWSWRYESHKSL